MTDFNSPEHMRKLLESVEEIDEIFGLGKKKVSFPKVAPEPETFEVPASKEYSEEHNVLRAVDEFAIHVPHQPDYDDVLDGVLSEYNDLLDTVTFRYHRGRREDFSQFSSYLNDLGEAVDSVHSAIKMIRAHHAETVDAAKTRRWL